VPFELGLRITVDLPNKVYVHGSGLDSEWAGKLQITGTTAQPVVRGQLTPRRGQFDALGRAFDLKDSAITFDGGPSVDPLLAINAVAKTGDVTAIVQVTGRASKPEITFTSNPILPEDEVVSRLLFGRGTGKLSAFEALQLAETLAVFSGAAGSGPGVLDKVRNALHLDVLRFDSGEDDDPIGTLTAGEYIRNDVFVGVSQGTTPGSTAATVEYDVTDDIVVEGKVGEPSSVGVKWQWDY
jgi:translocation and assembly module TamB